MKKHDQQQQQIVGSIVELPLNTNNPWGEKWIIFWHNLLIPWQKLKLEHTFYNYNHLKQQI